MSESRKRNNAIILTSVFAYVFIYFLLIFRLIPNYATVINGIFTLVLTVSAYFMYGFQHCGLNKTRKKVLLQVLAGLIIYFALIYILGLSTGFMKNSYSLRFTSLVRNALLPVLSLVALELFRYIFVSSNKDSKETIIYMTIAVILLDIVLNFYNIQATLVAIFIYITVKVFPIIFKNVVMTYLTYQVGFHSCLLYVIPISLFKYVLPYIPNLGNFIYAVIDISLPSLIYIFTSKTISDELSENESVWEEIKTYIITIPLIIIFSVVIALLSGVFNYHLIGINTSLMKPKIKRGDLVMVYKNIKYDKYNEGDIIVYKNEKDYIIAKIDKKDTDADGITSLYVLEEININEAKEKEYKYKLITKEMLVGRYDKFKISKIAYPTIWFNEFIKGDVHEN